MSEIAETNLPTHLATRLVAWLANLTGLNPRELKRFIKFATVGAIGMVVDLTLLNVLHKAVGLPLLMANAFSFSAAVVSNFTWNRLWTFPESRARPVHAQLAQFAVVNIIGLGINELVLWTVHQFTQQVLPDPFDYNAAKVFAIGVVLFWNYGVNRLWTYRGIR